MFFIQFDNEKDIYGPFKDLDSIDAWLDDCETSYRIISPLSPKDHTATPAWRK